MAALVEEALGDSQVALIEAPTGTARRSPICAGRVGRRRIVISTGTKACRSKSSTRIFRWRKGARPSIKAEVVKGRRNYLCRARFHLFRQQPTLNSRRRSNCSTTCCSGPRRPKPAIAPS
jgi:Rad3-related DNA helicase